MSVRIGIIDSGVKTNHPYFKDKKVIGYSLKFDEYGNIYRNSNFEDDIGHGTAIYFIISNETKNASITNIKIYSENISIDSNQFEQILEYIYINEKFDLLNISMGIVAYGNIKKLEKICEKLTKNGTCMISAFDNDGAVSFPAALKNVIGVDALDDINIARAKYICVKNSIVNILAKKINIRVAWVKPDYIIVKGSSFSCAEVTAKLASSKSNKTDTICCRTINYERTLVNKINYKIKKAVVYPFNKEIHSIARFYDLLDFEIVDFYSSRITGQVNRKLSDLIENCSLDKMIKNIDNLEWETFDTIIIGHLSELSEIAKIDYSKKLINEAINRKKNIYSFDNCYEMTKGYKEYYSPVINRKLINKRYGKLYKPDIPILSIIGTNSKQGKFTLQLLLRKKLLKLGYRIGQLGTEPSSKLFNMDECFHSGYKSQMDLEPYEICSLTNQMLWNISQKNVDIIITGCQSGLLPYNDYNVSMLPFQHQIMFESMQTDGIILCINSFDTIDFVERTIKFAEGASGGKIIGLVCFPLDYKDSWKASFGAKSRISASSENKIKKEYKEKLDKNVYMLDDDKDIDDLINECINFFGE